MKPEFCVIYLARAANDFSTFRNFLKSYQQFEAGIPHRLLILYKGFLEGSKIDRYEAELNSIEHARLDLPDIGFDITAYAAAAHQVQEPFLCFLNSFSRIQDAQWLGRFGNAVQQPDIGLAGASGSWESFYSNVLNERAHGHRVSITKQIARPIRLFWARWKFNPFPNFHLRTNAFVISRSLFKTILPEKIDTKTAAWCFESGKNSFTNRVASKHLDVVVVGKDGKTYRKEDWALSNTFRQNQQENLLVADNRTDQYLNSSPEEKKFLSRLAWGDASQTSRCD